jgi:hypothetical protein
MKSGSNNPKWKGGICYDRLRKGIYSPHHPHPNFNKIYVYEYILIVEEILGRYLKKGEIVHHKNGDQTDITSRFSGRLTQREHINLHRKEMQNEKWRKGLIINKRDAKGRIVGGGGNNCNRY